MAFSFNGAVPGLITLGNDSTTQNLYALTNKVESRVNVFLRRATVQIDTIAALTSVMPIVRISRATSISGGAILAPSTYDTTQTSNANVEVRSAVMDGFPITATQGNTVWQQYCGRMHTIVEQVLAPDNNVLPMLVDTQNFIVRPGESVLCQVNGAANASNARLANYWWVACEWEEESVTTFAISGTVTLLGMPVDGATVTIIQADDLAMTNPVLVEKVVTSPSGTWASSIVTGKVGVAFYQYIEGANYFTADNSTAVTYLASTGDTILNAIAALNDISTSDVQTAAGAALTVFGAATQTQLTAGVDSIIAQVDANEVKIDLIQAKTDNLPASPAAVGSAMTLEADAVNSTSLGASAVTEIQTGLSTLDEAGVRDAVGLASPNLDTQIADVQTLADELHKIQGLDAANPMTVTPTTRVAGDIDLDITGDGETTTTVTRIP